MIEQVRDLGPDYELVTNSQDIQSWLNTVGASDLAGDAGCLFVSFDDPQGGIEGYRVFLCESSVPRDGDWVWEIYPNMDY